MRVNFFSPINNFGYGIHAYNTIRAFEGRGHQVTIIPPLGQFRKEDEHVKRWKEERINFSAKRPSVMIFNEEYLTQFCGSPRIGFPVFELEAFTPLQLACIKSCDYLFTPTAWAAGVLAANGISPSWVRIVHEGFDPQTFPFIEKSTAEEAGDPFTFLHVGKFEERKGTLQAVRCFARALAEEEARLILHIHNPFIENYGDLSQLIQQLHFSEFTEGVYRFKKLEIRLSQPVEEHAHMSFLYRQADCGLFPTRAEGWGLPIIECLATGAPVIAGSWTGQSEFLNRLKIKDFILQKSEQVPAADGVWFDGTRGNWHVPDDEELIGKIMSAYTEGRKLRKSDEWRAAVEEVRRRFTWAEAARQMEMALRDLIGI